MSKIRLHGSSSGYTEIAPVAASGNNTLTLPNDGTIISQDSNGAVGVTSITVGTGVTIGDGKITCDGSALTSINAAQLVGVCTSGLTKTGGFGKILQVLYTESTTSVTTTGSRTQLLTQAITPTAASSKLKVTFSFDYDIEENGDSNVLGFVYIARQVASGSFSKIAGIALGARNVGAGNEYNGSAIITLDSPSYTLGNDITYKLQCENYSSGSTISITQNTGVPRTSHIILEEISA